MQSISVCGVYISQMQAQVQRRPEYRRSHQDIVRLTESFPKKSLDALHNILQTEHPVAQRGYADDLPHHVAQVRALPWERPENRRCSTRIW